MFLIITIIFALFVITCQPSGSAEDYMGKGKEKEQIAKTYTPPKDGKITEAQAEKYIKIAKAFHDMIMEQIGIMEEFYQKYDITSKDEIDKIQSNPKAMEEWEKIILRWEENESKIYIDYKMSSDEFDWVASALIDDKNKEIQQKIQKALEGE